MMARCSPLRVLVVGVGNMGRSHALAYHNNEGYEIVGIVKRSKSALPPELQHYPLSYSYKAALEALKPDVVSISTYADTHADYAIAALESGAHVFLEKPIATTVEDARRVVDAAHACDKKLLVGYILRHHPSWITLVQEARKLGGPYVFRLNLNQQSSGKTWKTHKNLMETTSPIVDCGVHYVDVMCQVADAKPVKVSGIGLRLSNEIDPKMYNYGHFQVVFEDGSVGWYEAGWGPMMSQAAFFVKDIISPGGSVSIIVQEDTKSDDVDAHTKTSLIRVHSSETNCEGVFANADRDLQTQNEPDHNALCVAEQNFLLQAISEDVDLSRHLEDAVQSLRICLAADESVRTGKEIYL